MPTAAWGDAAVIVPWVLYRRTGDLGHAPPPVSEHARLGGPGRGGGRRSPSVGQRVAVGRLARSHRAARPSGGCPDRSQPGGDRLSRRSPRRSWPRPRALLGLQRRQPALPPARRGRPGRVRAGVRLPERAAGQRRADRVRPRRWSSACWSREQRQRAGARLVELVQAGDHRIATGFVGTPIICDALSHIGAYGHRLPPADPTRVPVLALPGDDGRHHDLGTLGQHAARWSDQPG